jgi:hypothetical protein
MAAAALPAPGTEYGPCVEPCEHSDCASTRELAATPCVECHEPIGYDDRFYQLGDWQHLEHLKCSVVR